MFKIKQFVFNPFDESTFLLIDDATKDTIVVDPGMFTDTDFKQFDDFVAAHRLNITQVVNTHMHIDHCFGENHVKDKYGVTTAANIGDADYAANIEKQGIRFGIRRAMPPITIDVQLKEGDTIQCGQSRLKVLHVPGHSQGGIALYCAEQNFVLSGDSLFRGSIGRTDFDGGNQQQLINSVRQKLLTLPDETAVLPGHGPYTTIGTEKLHNPYL